MPNSGQNHAGVENEVINRRKASLILKYSVFYSPHDIVYRMPEPNTLYTRK